MDQLMMYDVQEQREPPAIPSVNFASRPFDYIGDLSRFVMASASSYHAVAEAARRLRESGFQQLVEGEEWRLHSGGFFVVRDGALVAFKIPEKPRPEKGFAVFGAHTDSPTFKLKPKPTTGKYGWLQAGVEVYGGPLLHTWLDRELRLAGRLALRDGRAVLTETPPLVRFPQLAVHLDRSMSDGLTLDRQDHMQPVWGLGEADQADLLSVLAKSAQETEWVDPATIGGYDIVVADCQEPTVFGGAQELFASGRLDNLTSVHAGLRALISHRTRIEGPVAVLAAFDHEEIGSASPSGASGPLLADTLVRITAGLMGSDRLQLALPDETWHRALANSVCLSADAGHGVHPNYTERHDPANRPVLGGGVLLKINANQRYATDAVGAALVAKICLEENIPYQEFVSRNDVPCGSTIGPLTATRLGIRTVDVGVPLLSMHSARELCAVADPPRLSRLAEAFFSARH